MLVKLAVGKSNNVVQKLVAGSAIAFPYSLRHAKTLLFLMPLFLLEMSNEHVREVATRSDRDRSG